MGLNVSVVESEVNKWLQLLKRDAAFVWTKQALHTIPNVERDDRLPTALTLLYLQRRIPISIDWQARFVVLMRTMLEKGHVADGILNRKPVWLHLFQCRFAELYPFLKRPPMPSAPIYTVSGFLWCLGKVRIESTGKWGIGEGSSACSSITF